MGDLHLPGGLVVPHAHMDRPRIRCARNGCRSTTERRIRAEDNPTPAPADAGWFEVELDGTQRTVLFACSQRCAQAVAAVHVTPDLKSVSAEAPPVLPS